MKKTTRRESEREPKAPAPKHGECGMTHGDCISTWKGCCDREAGHGGSHHCSSCNSTF
ncbi:MAG: hypothetical protein IPJ17_10160 [Holophagales bacterium]|nr:MAG: hypothetical protein IPJ17_10160 [Holophagales bacterium]